MSLTGLLKAVEKEPTVYPLSSRHTPAEKWMPLLHQMYMIEQRMIGAHCNNAFPEFAFHHGGEETIWSMHHLAPLWRSVIIRCPIVC